MLADDPKARVSVVGQLIIDSPHHIPRSRLKTDTVDPELKGMPGLVQKAFDNCDIMLEDWELPNWDAPSGGAKLSQVSVRGGKVFDVRPGKALYKPLVGDWRAIDHRIHQHGEPARLGKLVAPPPAVMVRCVKPVPKTLQSEKPALIDLHRKDTLLGWQGSYPDFIKATIDVDADHYNVFDRTDGAKVRREAPACERMYLANKGQIKNMTVQMNEGLDILESLNKPKPKPKPARPMMEYF